MKKTICIFALILGTGAAMAQTKTPTFPKREATTRQTAAAPTAATPAAAAAAPATRAQCTAITQKGTQCRRSIAASNKLYCSQHYGMSLSQKQ